MVNITAHVAEKESHSSTAEYEPGVVNRFNNKLSLDRLRHGHDFGLLLYTDMCSWCKKIRNIWRNLARQCQHLIFVEAKSSDIIYGEFSDLLTQGNGIYYIIINQTDTVIFRFVYDTTVAMIKEFVTHKGDAEHMDIFMASNTNISADEEQWPENLLCDTTTREESTTMEDLLSVPTYQMTLHENKTSLGIHHIAHRVHMATISVSVTIMSHYAETIAYY